MNAVEDLKVYVYKPTGADPTETDICVGWKGTFRGKQRGATWALPQEQAIEILIRILSQLQTRDSE